MATKAKTKTKPKPKAKAKSDERQRELDKWQREDDKREREYEAKKKRAMYGVRWPELGESDDIVIETPEKNHHQYRYVRYCDDWDEARLEAKSMLEWKIERLVEALEVLVDAESLEDYLETLFEQRCGEDESE